MRTVFYIANGLIALDYLLIAVLWVKRIKLPRKRHRNIGATVAMGAATVFFVGCAHTHIDLLYEAYVGTLEGHWYTWWNVTSHVAQGLGGAVFWLLATYYLQLNIFDKKHYESVTSSERQDRLEFLAKSAGVWQR